EAGLGHAVTLEDGMPGVRPERLEARARKGRRAGCEQARTTQDGAIFRMPVQVLEQEVVHRRDTHEDGRALGELVDHLACRKLGNQDNRTLTQQASKDRQAKAVDMEE